jgi:hypothetical protein
MLPREKSPVLRHLSLLGLFALAPIVLVGCFWTTTVDSVPRMTFNGLVYDRILLASAELESEDLRQVGEAASVDDPGAVVGMTVFSLKGVPEDRLLVMRSSNVENGDYLFFWRPEQGVEPSVRVSDTSNLIEFVNSIPGLCAYFSDVPCATSR